MGRPAKPRSTPAKQGGHAKRARPASPRHADGLHPEAQRGTRGDASRNLHRDHHHTHRTRTNRRRQRPPHRHEPPHPCRPQRSSSQQGVGPAVGDLPHLTRPRVGGQIQVTVAPAKENVRTDPPTRASSWPSAANRRTRPATAMAGPHSKAAAARRWRGVRAEESGTGTRVRADPSTAEARLQGPTCRLPPHSAMNPRGSWNSDPEDPRVPGAEPSVRVNSRRSR